VARLVVGTKTIDFRLKSQGEPSAAGETFHVAAAFGPVPGDLVFISSTDGLKGEIILSEVPFFAPVYDRC